MEVIVQRMYRLFIRFNIRNGKQFIVLYLLYYIHNTIIQSYRKVLESRHIGFSKLIQNALFKAYSYFTRLVWEKFQFE